MIKVSHPFVKANCRSMMAVTLIVAAQSLVSTQFAFADWRKEMGVFRVGIATNGGEPFKAEALEGFRLQMKRTLAMPVEIFQARDASSLIDAAASSRIEYAILSSLGFVTLDLTCDCVSPIVAPTSEEGATMVRSSLIVNSEKVSNLEDIVGKRLAIGPDNSLTGSILPIAQFSINGAGPTEADIELVRVESVEQAVDALADGGVDGFFGWELATSNSSDVFETSLSAKLKNYPDLETKTIWNSEPVRFGPHVIHKSVPPEAENALRNMLTGLHEEAPLVYQNISPNLAGGLKPVTAQDYISAFTLIRSITRQAVSGKTNPNMLTSQ
jgi:phosphonate transport system substrate-binding protein